MVDNPESMVESIDEAVKMAESSRYAFFGEETTVDYIRGRYCDLEKYGGNINENAYGVAMAPCKLR